MDGRKIVSTARQFLNTPFIPQGRKARIGVDCIGLVTCVAKINKIPVNDHVIYKPHEWAGDRLLRKIEQELEPLVKLENGCILLIWFRRSHLPQHLAIYTERNTIIHTTENFGKVVEMNYDEKWQKRTHSIWKFKEV